MDSSDIKHELHDFHRTDTEMQFLVKQPVQSGRNPFESIYDPNPLGIGNISRPRYEPFIGKKLRIHIGNCDMVLDIEIRSKFDVLTECDRSREQRFIWAHTAACLLRDIQFSPDEVNQAFDYRPVMTQGGTFNDYYVGGNYRDTFGSDIAGNVESFPSTDETKAALDAINMADIKSEFTVELNESTDEYSDNDLENSAADQTLGSTTYAEDSHPEQMPPAHLVSVIGAQDYNISSKTKSDTRSTSTMKDSELLETRLVREKRYFQCVQCEYMTDHKGALQRHIKYKHMKYRAFHCSLCPFKSVEARDLRRHISRIHTNERIYQCYLCTFKCAESTGLKLHVGRKHKGELPFKCLACDFKCDDMRVLKEHVMTEHNTERFHGVLTNHDYNYGKCELSEMIERTNVFPEVIVKSEFNGSGDNNNETLSTIAADDITHGDDKLGEPQAPVCAISEISAKDSNIKSQTKKDKKPSSSKKDPVKLETKFVHGKRYFKCLECEYLTDHKQSLKRHIRYKHTNERAFQCNHCPSKFVEAACLNKHIMRKHTNENAYRCYLCKYECVDACDMRIHMSRMHIGELPFMCSTCEFKCDNVRVLKHHVMTDHKGKTLFACSQCDHKSMSKHSLNDHVRNRHLRAHPFTCSEIGCNFSCADEAILEKHRIKKHIGEQCPKCDYITKISGHLTTHMRTHTLPFMCHLCPFRTAQKQCLKVHIQGRHTGDHPHKCQECQYKCSYPSQLQTHILLKHRRQRNILCPICGVSLSRKLDQHIKVKHTGEKPYKCSQCVFRCNNAYNLKQHIICKHTGEKRYKCHICNFACQRTDALNKHLMSQHYNI